MKKVIKKFVKKTITEDLPKKECLYCLTMFHCEHQLRKFCPSKYGIHDYCKRKFKELVAHAKLTGQTVVLTSKDSLSWVTMKWVGNKAVENKGGQNQPNLPLAVVDPNIDKIRKENEILKVQLADRELNRQKEVIKYFAKTPKIDPVELRLEGARFNYFESLAKLYGFYFKHPLHTSKYYTLVYPYPKKYDNYEFE